MYAYIGAAMDRKIWVRGSGGRRGGKERKKIYVGGNLTR